jgi:hypothetical protein
MLTVTDFGCSLHLFRQLNYFGPEAKVVEEVVSNLPSDGNCHTYICVHGHTHRLLVNAAISTPAAERWSKLSSY